MINTEFILALLEMKGIGKKAVYLILSKIKTPIKIFDELDALLNSFSQTTNKFSQKIYNINRDLLEIKIKDFNEKIHKIRSNQILVINISENNYPYLLKLIKDPPLVLFIKGNYEPINEFPSLAVIGTRNPESESMKTAFNIAKLAAEKKFNVISGLAKGCDAAAHEGALSMNAYTAAILPCGFNNIYPKANISLANKIIEKGGCLISEYFPNDLNKAYRFVERDRIQSGLSKGVIVVESSLNSGTMKTANFTLRDKRKLAVVIDGKSAFSGNELLKKNNEVIKLKNKKNIECFLESLSKESINFSQNYIQGTLF